MAAAKTTGSAGAYKKVGSKTQIAKAKNSQSKDQSLIGIGAGVKVKRTGKPKGVKV